MTIFLLLVIAWMLACMGYIMHALKKVSGASRTMEQSYRCAQKRLELSHANVTLAYLRERHTNVTWKLAHSLNDKNELVDELTSLSRQIIDVESRIRALQ